MSGIREYSYMMKFIKQLFGSRTSNSSDVVRVKPVICKECRCVIPLTLLYTESRTDTNRILYGRECDSCIRDEKLKQIGI
jgi:hypothetical protein